MKNCGVYFIVLGLFFINESIHAQQNDKKVPLEYIKEFYSPLDNLTSSFPTWFLAKSERLKIESLRLSEFKKNYKIDFASSVKKKRNLEPIIKPSDVKKLNPKKYKPRLNIYGYYFDEVTKKTIVNVNGRFVRLEKLLKTHNVCVIKSVPGLLVVQANKKTYRIEVGKPLSL